LVGGTVATASGALALTSNEASGSVEISELTIPDETYVLTDESIEDVRIETQADWSWEGNAEATSYELRLKVGSTVDNAEIIARKEQDGLGKKELQGTATLTGSVLDTSIYDSSNFTPSNGSLSTNVIVLLEFDVLRDGEVVESAEATEGVTISVRKEELAYTVSLSSSGEVIVSSS